MTQDVLRQRKLAALYLTAISYWGADWDRAIINFNELYSIEPEYMDVEQRLYDAYLNKGDLYADQGEWCSAEEQYALAVEIQPHEAGEETARMSDAWRTMQRSHAIANGLYVAAVNRVGREGEIDFFGSSFVATPLGDILAEASNCNEELLIVDIDKTAIEETRRTWPFLRDRRIDLYGGLTQRLIDDQK